MEEALNNSAQSTAAPAAQPAAAPAAPAAQPVAAQPAAAPSYTVTPSASASSESSSGGDGILELLKGLNWIEIGVGMLGVAVLFSAASYFRNNNKLLQPSLTDMQNKIDKLTIELSDVKSALEKKVMQQQASTQQGFI